ncbi:MAG: flavodoxin family protein [Elusimicrobiota bacterium]|jgi:multimeric flavodoxin WrbA|nr:flavodoxin family protein [Elusimicrobiota bacterium]
MKVLLINGSPHEKECVWTALREVEKSLNEEDIDAEIFHIGTKPIAGCIDCGKCENGLCALDGIANTVKDKMAQSDGLIIGSPVYFAGANGSLIALLDRVFFSGRKSFIFKPAAAIVSARRAGTTAALDQINKYFLISQMPVVSSKYWNMVHGFNAEETKQDLEGMQVMRVLGKNMAWLLKCIEQAKKAGIEYPKPTEQNIMTNFIR